MADVDPQEPDAGALARFRELMDDDLNTPGVVALLFGLVTEANTALDGGDATAAGRAWATVREICDAVGIQLVAGAEVPAEIENLARLRDEARGAKDWAEADRLRDEIRAAGWEVEDTADGTRVHPA
jgi:cysteinyl-tRNA synthetase